MPIDHVLKLYSKSFRSPYLHYGFWDEPDKINADNLTLNDILVAQERYIEHLVSFIPKDVKTILDVGAGIAERTIQAIYSLNGSAVGKSICRLVKYHRKSIC